mgnify:CR=1 FL=1
MHFEHDCSALINNKNKISKELMDLCQTYLNKWKKENVPLKKYHLCFSVYYSSRKINYPLSLKEISRIFSISIKRLCKLEKFIPIEEIFSPYQYIEKYCKYLSLRNNDIKIIFTHFKNIDKKYNTSFNIKIAALIYLLYPNISLKKISNTTFVTENTIKKWSNIFKH